MRLSALGNRILYGEVSPSFYTRNRAALNAGNYAVLRRMSSVLFSADLFFVLVCLVTGAQTIVTETCLAYTAVLFLVMILIRTSPGRQKTYLDAVYYVLYFLAYSQALIQSTVFSPHDRMVSVLLVIVMLPILYIEPPVRSYATNLISCLIALIAARAVKAGTPPLVFDDTVAVMACCLVNFPFIRLIRGVNLHNIQARAYFRQKAETDELTGISNREGSLRQVKGFLEKGSPCILFMIDIDKFKEINDRYGHAGGDRALQMIGRVLLNCSHREDVVGRFGGDEFILLLENTASLQLAERKAALIRRDFSQLCEKEGISGATCSIGIAARLTGPTEFEPLYRTADKALYRAKAAGRNCEIIAR